ncbi:MAG: cbb3-type cytochrome c oxidase N-terminal domain-containing protein [Cyclobacteriaceae bacterium]
MKNISLVLFTLIGWFFVVPGFGQTDEGNSVGLLQNMDSNQWTLLIIIGVVLALILIMMLVMVYLLSFLKTVLRGQNPAMPAESGSWWEDFKEKYVVGKMTPIEEEKDIALDHSYDGIVELDNFMPPWLKYVFYMSIAFAVIYFVNYSVLGIGDNQYEEYEEELAIAEEEAELFRASDATTIDETNVQFDKSGPGIQAGKDLYETNCAACHAMDGGGGVGPNFTDQYWIHGGSINDVFSVVKYGVVEKGMIPWQDQLSPEQIQQVSSYILTMQGGTPANPKAPQGELYEEEIQEPIDALGEDELGLEPADDGDAE